MKDSANSMPTKKSPNLAQKRVKSPKTVPKQPKPGSAAFKRLQKQWYKKLAKADPDYKDIEGGREHGLINGQSLADPGFVDRVQRNSSATQHYYSRWTCYIAYNSGGQLTPMERAIATLYAEKGYGPAKISKILRKRKRTKRFIVNTFQCHYIIERLRLHVEYWNRTNHNGMDYVSDIGP